MLDKCPSKMIDVFIPLDYINLLRSLSLVFLVEFSSLNSKIHFSPLCDSLLKFFINLASKFFSNFVTQMGLRNRVTIPSRVPNYISHPERKIISLGSSLSFSIAFSIATSILFTRFQSREIDEGSPQS